MPLAYFQALLLCALMRRSDRADLQPHYCNTCKRLKSSRFRACRTARAQPCWRDGPRDARAGDLRNRISRPIPSNAEAHLPSRKGRDGFRHLPGRDLGQAASIANKKAKKPTGQRQARRLDERNCDFGTPRGERELDFNPRLNEAR